MDLKIMLWNARGWKNKKEELWKRCQDYDVNIITEIKAKNMEGLGVTGYNTMIKHRINKRTDRGIGGVAIIIKRFKTYRNKTAG